MPLYAMFLEDEIDGIPVADGAGGVVIPTRSGKIFVTAAAFANDAGHPRVMKVDSWAPLTVEQLTDPAPLPGNDPAVPGFVGSTVQVSGNFDSDTGRIVVDYLPPFDPDQGEPTAEPFPNVVVGPPEFVIGGPLTAALANGTLGVAGAAIRVVGEGQPTNDLRLPQLGGPRNDFGIPINLAAVKPLMAAPGGKPATPPLAAVAGWWSLPEGAAQRQFIAYDVVVDTTDRRTLVDPLTPQIAVTKAQARRRGSLYDVNVQGGLTAVYGPPGGATTTLANPQRVAVHRVDFDPVKQEWVEDPEPLGFDNDVRVVRGKPFSKWQVRVTKGFPAGRPFPPMKVRARVVTAPDWPAGVERPVSPDGEELVEWIKG